MLTVTEEMRQKKLELQESIRLQIINFEAITGLTVTDLQLNPIVIERIDGKVTRHQEIIVRVEL